MAGHAKDDGEQVPEANSYLSQNHTTLDANKSKTKHNILINRLEVHKRAPRIIGFLRDIHRYAKASHGGGSVKELISNLVYTGK
jgi:hypothetical protein